MRFILFTTFFLWLNTYSVEAQSLNIGDDLPAANERMEDVNGRSVTLSETYRPNGLIVIFSSNTCPMVRRWEERFKAISRLSKASNMGLIVLNSNEDYRDRGDGMEDMIKHSKKAGYDFPYVLDEDHRVADAFGAEKTPHIFLFDGTRTLAYMGAIDDNAYDRTAVQNAWLENAVNALLNAETIDTPITKPIGCSIKRVN
jgi:thioredoxin-related protein